MPLKSDIEAAGPVSERVLAGAATVLLLAALLLGGATREGELPNAIVRLLSLPVMLLALWRICRLPPPREARYPMLLMAAVLALPFLQLIPMPSEMWGSLPGRAQFLEAYVAAGMASPWLPVSLSPEGTWNAALALLPPAAVFLSVLTLDGRARRRMTPWILAVVTASVVLGVLQLGGGPGSPLRFYDITNASAAVGFFANRNHQASLLLAALPLATLWAVTGVRRAEAHRPLVIVIGLGLTAVFIVGLVVSQSRAGLLLAIPGAIGCLFMLVRAEVVRLDRKAWWALGAVAAVVVLLGLAVVAGAGGERLGGMLAGEQRIDSAPVIAGAGADHLPFGSGLGTFDQVYRMYEKPQTLTRPFLNHAHDDYLELWLETGLVGVALLAAFVAWFAISVRRAWSLDGSGKDLARAASLAVGLLLIHSLVDYPLRTTAVAALFAFACGCLAPPPGQVERSLEAARPLRRTQIKARAAD